MARDFRKKKFQRVLRGYDEAEVDAYLGQINEEFRKLERAKSESDQKAAQALEKINELNGIIAEQSHNISELTGILPERAEALRQAEEERKRRAEEEQNRQTAEAKQRNEQAEVLLKEAEEKLAQADRIREEAAQTAEKRLAAAHTEAEAAKAEAETALSSAKKLYGEVCSFRDVLFQVYNTHIELVEDIAGKAERFLADTEKPEQTDSSTQPEEERTEEDAADFYDEDELGEDPDEPLILFGAPAGEEEPEKPTEESETSEEPEAPEAPEQPEASEEPEAPEQPEASEATEAAETPEQSEAESADFVVPDESMDFDLPAEPEQTESAAAEPEQSLPAEPEQSLPAEPEQSLPAEPEQSLPAKPEQQEEKTESAPEASETPTDGKAPDQNGEETPNFNLGELFRMNREAKGRGKKKDGSDLDVLFVEPSAAKGSSLEEEFTKIYGGNGKKNVEEIRRQPTVVPEQPKKPKKHKKY